MTATSLSCGSVEVLGRSRPTKMSESSREVVEQESTENTEEGSVVPADGVFRSLLRGLFWPFSIVVRVFRGFWGLLRFWKPEERVLPGPATSSPARPSLTARKRLRWVSRLVLVLLPRRVQGALGYPVSSRIGRSLSPEVGVSPTKLHGKGSKRKQDDLDEDDSGEEDHPTWVEVLSMDLPDEGSEEDPDYEPSAAETDSEEYASQNNTESELQTSRGENVNAVPAEASCP